MKSVAVIGTVGKDEHLRITSAARLPAPFLKFLKKTLAFSTIEQFYGEGWNMDRVYDELRRNITSPISYSYGGRAPHVAYGLALLKGPVSLVTTFGSDYDYPYPGFFGGGYVTHLRKSGVSFNTCELEADPNCLDAVDTETLNTEVWIATNRLTSTIVCVKDGEGNDFFYIDDVKGAGRVESWRPVPRRPLKEADIVFVTSSETTYMADAVRAAHSYGKRVVLDVGSYGVTTEYLVEVVPRTDILLGNQSELRQVLSAFGLARTEEILEVSSDKPEAVVSEDKISGRMTVFERCKDPYEVGPVHINKSGGGVGACDGMATGILSALQRDLELELACKIGLLEAASIWEVEGVQEGMLKREKLFRRYTRNFGRTQLGILEEEYR